MPWGHSLDAADEPRSIHSEIVGRGCNDAEVLSSVDADSTAQVLHFDAALRLARERMPAVSNGTRLGVSGQPSQRKNYFQTARDAVGQDPEGKAPWQPYLFCQVFFCARLGFGPDFGISDFRHF